MITFYKKPAPPLGVDFCHAGDARIAARFAPVAPHGELRSLGEHRLLCDSFGRHARMGRLFGRRDGSQL